MEAAVYVWQREGRTGKVDRHSSHAHLQSPGIVGALFSAAKVVVLTPHYHTVVSHEIV